MKILSFWREESINKIFVTYNENNVTPMKSMFNYNLTKQTQQENSADQTYTHFSSRKIDWFWSCWTFPARSARGTWPCFVTAEAPGPSPSYSARWFVEWGVGSERTSAIATAVLLIFIYTYLFKGITQWWPLVGMSYVKHEIWTVH